MSQSILRRIGPAPGKLGAETLEDFLPAVCTGTEETWCGGGRRMGHRARERGLDGAQHPTFPPHASKENRTYSFSRASGKSELATGRSPGHMGGV